MTQEARKFVEHWTYRRGSEKGEDQQFWNDLLGEVFGVADVSSRIRYQVPVPMGGTTKFLDAWIPSTRVLIEHKSRGVDLSAPQSGHGGLTPYEQACEYDNARPFDEKARWIVTCNFDRFEIHDRARPLAPPLVVRLRDLPKEAHRLAFLVDPKEKAVDRELEISVQAGRIVGELYDALLKRYGGKVNSDASEGSANASPVRNAGAVAEASDKSEFSSDALAALNRLCVRLVFCLYAEDAGVFPKDCFRRLVEASDAHRLRRDLLTLFRVLDTPVAERDPYLEPELAAFPYTNGGLFRVGLAAKGLVGRDDPIAPRTVGRDVLGAPPRGLDDIPPLTEEIRQLLLGASRFDWREITPTIFGALFESTLNPETRRSGGMVYTSVENIHKVIDPLFLDDLTAELDGILGVDLDAKNAKDAEGLVGRRVPAPPQTMGLTSATLRRLAAFQDKLASLTFLDPACGSGNFLTETYLSLRRLENRLIAARQGGQGELDLGAGAAKVTLAQFRGIEVNDFAVAVAKTALWIAEAQMRRETAEILHREPDYLPLRDFGGIVEGDALRLDWPRADFIMGNPPFVGASMMTAEQKAEAVAIFGKGKRVNSVDYVGAWYHKAAALMRGTATRTAFVSTNSITQGEQVAPMWRPLFERYGIVIDFAWRTFKWQNEAAEKAHVHCVIVGFHAEGGMVLAAKNAKDAKGLVGASVPLARGRRVEDAAPYQNPDNSVQNDSPRSPDLHVNNPTAAAPLRSLRPLRLTTKTIYSSDGTAHAAANVCPYLIDAPTVFVESRGAPLCDVPKMTYGCKPSDGGNLILSSAERDALLADEPTLADCIRRYVGAKDFINSDEVRYCLWLKDVPPSVYRRSKEVMRRLAAVREMRLKSSAAPTRMAAETPYLFFSITQSDTNYLLVPQTSSERRKYIPIGMLDKSVIASNAALIIPNATLYHFGVLTSIVHMAWMRVVTGRLGMSYQYSPAVVYNNFPWPEGTGGHAGRVTLPDGETVGRGVLDAPTGGHAGRVTLPNGESAGVVGSRVPRDRDEPGRREGLQRREERERPSAEEERRSNRHSTIRLFDYSIISQTAQAILSARARYPGSSLADLYDLLTMPPDLRAAHAANDRAVLAAYGLAADTPEPEIVSHLFRLYAEKVP